MSYYYGTIFQYFPFEGNNIWCTLTINYGINIISSDFILLCYEFTFSNLLNLKIKTLM